MDPTQEQMSMDDFMDMLDEEMSMDDYYANIDDPAIEAGWAFDDLLASYDFE